MLDRRLYKIIKETLGKDYVENYPEDLKIRIIVQKTLYLLTHGNSKFKISLPYKWSFYLQGPYSSDIAHMLFHIKEFWEEIDNKSIELEEQDKKGIEHFNEFIKNIEEIMNKNKDIQRISKHELYELMATLTYAAGQIGNNKDEIRDVFSDLKSSLKEKVSNSIFNSSYEILEKFSYI